MGLEILAFGIHCSANIQPILDCFIPNFKLKYEDSENMKIDRVNTVVFNLHQLKQRNFFGTPGKHNVRCRTTHAFGGQVNCFHVTLVYNDM